MVKLFQNAEERISDAQKLALHKSRQHLAKLSFEHILLKAIERHEKQLLEGKVPQEWDFLAGKIHPDALEKIPAEFLDDFEVKLNPRVLARHIYSIDDEHKAPDLTRPNFEPSANIIEAANAHSIISRDKISSAPLNAEDLAVKGKKILEVQLAKHLASIASIHYNKSGIPNFIPHYLVIPIEHNGNRFLAKWKTDKGNANDGLYGELLNGSLIEEIKRKASKASVSKFLLSGQTNAMIFAEMQRIAGETKKMERRARLSLVKRILRLCSEKNAVKASDWAAIYRIARGFRRLTKQVPKAGKNQAR